MSGVEFTLRRMADSDRNYVLSSWLRSYAKSREARDYRQTQAYYEDYEPVVQDIVDRSEVVVACMPDVPDVVLGWMAIEGDALHYVLVKPRWRRLKLATELLRELGGMRATFTHRTPLWDKFPVSPLWDYRRLRIYRKAA